MSSAYHPESQGALERWHQTLKAMLQKYCCETGLDWDEGLPLYSLRNVMQNKSQLGSVPPNLCLVTMSGAP